MAFSLTSLNIEKLREMLQARGLQIGNIQTGRDGNRNFGLMDPERNIIEFVQYMPGSMLSETRGKYLQGRISTHLYHAGIIAANADTMLGSSIAISWVLSSSGAEARPARRPPGSTCARPVHAATISN